MGLWIPWFRLGGKGQHFDGSGRQGPRLLANWGQQCECIRVPHDLSDILRHPTDTLYYFAMTAMVRYLQGCERFVRTCLWILTFCQNILCIRSIFLFLVGYIALHTKYYFLLSTFFCFISDMQNVYKKNRLPQLGQNLALGVSPPKINLMVLHCEQHSHTGSSFSARSI